MISIAGLVAATGAAVAGGKFRTNIVQRGPTWWCDSFGQCHRDEADCTEDGNTCGEVIDAYVFTSGDSVLYDVHAYATKALCMERQRSYDEDVSVCVRVGPTKIPAPKIPRGRGWYCMTYQADTMGIVECVRSKKECDKHVEAVLRVGTAGLGAKLGSRCEFHAKLWASASWDLTEEASITRTREECESSRKVVRGYPCVEVK
jgi:hypothetical protein